jgi:hypothetical protein
MNGFSMVSRFARGGFVVFLALACLAPPAGLGAEIVINEIMANNTSVAPLDDFPEYTPDYVELYNTTSSRIDLAAGQWTLSNKKTPLAADNKDFFFFPPGTFIEADSYLLVFFDNETNFPGIHTTFLAGGTNRTTFTLARTGDRVQLYKNHAELVDSNLFGIQVPNYSVGRVPDFTGPFTLTIPSPCGGTIPCQTNAPAPFVPPPTGSNEMTLKINEWLALSQSGTNIGRDWFEVYNPDTNIVLLSGLVFADEGTTNSISLPGLRAVPPLSFIGPQGFVQIFCLGSGQGDADDPDEVDFSLSSSNGDGVFIFTPDRTTVIDKVHFDAFTTANVSRGRLPDGGDFITPNSSPLPNRSPEESNFGGIPEVAINEILAHTDPPLEDAIELVNLTDTPQNISHWWLSNSRNNAKKYRIPNGTTIPARGYVVFYEYQFNHPATAAQPFTLNSARGDECYLFKGDASGRLTGFRRGLDFGPSDNGVSFGRHLTSQTNVDIVALSDLSLGTTVRRGDDESFLPIVRTGTGAANPTPRVGPVVINEIHYHHPEIVIGPGQSFDDIEKEYIELFNISDQPVRLFDPVNYGYADGRTNTWRLRDGVSFNFPQNVTLAPGEFVLVLKFDPSIPAKVTAFTNAFPRLAGRVPGQVRLFGPYNGTLGNGGDTVELQRPDAPQAPGRPDAGLVPYVVLDRVRYNDEAPWPTNTASVGPDGGGESLQRISSYEYGNDVINWRSATPTPGAFNTATGVEAPSIVTQPRSQTVGVGRTATFTVSARGGQLQYQWTQNGTNVPGANGATLSRVNVAESHAGPYQVIITNISGAITSVVATLTVNATIDTTPPRVAITSPSTFVLTNRAIVVRGTASDRVGVSGVFFTINESVNFLSATGSPTFSVWGSLVPPILSPGTNKVRAFSQDHAGNPSPMAERAYFLSVRDKLTFTNIVGMGTVRGATNDQLLEIGRRIPLEAKPVPRYLFSNWVVTTNMVLAYLSSSPKLEFLMASNTAVSAYFVTNPFYATAGQFNGLFYDNSESGVLHGSSGFFNLTLRDSGAYSAKLLAGGFKLSASGQFGVDGKATNHMVARKGTNALSIVWCLDLAGGDILTGTVSDAIAGWTAELHGDRAVFSKTRPCTNAGKYTFTLPGLPHDLFVPGGDSYGTVSINSNGLATFKGFLADKTGAAQKVSLSKDGQWPLYVPLYSGKGSLLSWIAFTNRPTDDFHGLLNWSKAAQPPAKGKYYTGGFSTNEATLVGSRYAAPTGTDKILPLTDAIVTLNGGNLPTDTTNSVTLGAGSNVTTNSPLPKLSLSFTLSSGLFKGSYTPTEAGARALSLAGAVLQKATNASGYFLGTNESGRVSLRAAP